MSPEEIKGIQELCSFIPYFENIDPDKVRQWEYGEKLENGARSMSYPAYDTEFLKFVDAFDKNVRRVGDYLKQLDRRVPDWQTADMHKVVATADFELVIIILTFYIRVERFADGAWDDSIRSGLFLAILRRMNDLLNIYKVKG